ncbi:MAG: hypothetical protein H0T62_12120 [Parachlamydiaceae bacterium]|nr:hypothetical protein [Parachlamydiaceae bacterium]
MIVFEAMQDTIDKLIEEDFKVIICGEKEGNAYTYMSNLTVHLERFFHIYLYLSEHWREYKYVVTTDVKDLVFQLDPISFLEQNLGEKKLIVGAESILYRDEPWGNQNLLETYGKFFHDRFKDNPIYNVGAIGGTSEYIKDICMNIFMNGVNRKIAVCDQSVFNVMIHTQPYKDTTLFCAQADGWACHAGTTADPKMVEKFRPYLLEGEPVFSVEDQKVYTENGNLFTIVHQYDRVPEWKKAFEAQSD